MLLDLHVHTSGISTCCLLDAKEILNRTKQVGLDGIVLCNHYVKSYVKEGFDKWINEYIDEFYYTKSFEKEFNLKVFFGVEVTMNYDPRVHILLYGATPEFLRANKELYDLSLKELYELCHENNIAVIQAHPFRNGTIVQNTNYLDGIEINCHPVYDRTNSDIIPPIALKNNLIVTCGCDYHGDTPYRANAGTYIPDYVKDEKDLAKYLLETENVKLRIQELNEVEFYEREFNFKRK